MFLANQQLSEGVRCLSKLPDDEPVAQLKGAPLRKGYIIKSHKGSHVIFDAPRKGRLCVGFHGGDWPEDAGPDCKADGSGAGRLVTFGSAGALSRMSIWRNGFALHSPLAVANLTNRKGIGEPLGLKIETMGES